MKYLSVCSGIEAASVAWEPLGWKPIGFSEIEPFPCKVLKHHYPEVKNYGSLLNWKEWNVSEKFDLLVGGTPCQSFSRKGKGEGFKDERGNLTLQFIQLAEYYNPRWILWENVVGVLSNDGGRTFARIIYEISKCGYGVAWRVFNSRYFGVPQSRRRIFLVGYNGADPRFSAKVLFEPKSESLRAFKIKKKRKEILKFRDQNSKSKIVYGVDSEFNENKNYIGALRCGRGEFLVYEENGKAIARWITPLESERLQGFPDNYTKISGAADTPRYRAVGNSKPIPVVRWIGERIMKIDSEIRKGNAQAFNCAL